jgi:hypothetical protein
MSATAYHFFYAHAGYSHGPNETAKQGRIKCAKRLAKAEAIAQARSAVYQWETSDIDSSDFSDEKPSWPLYDCTMYGMDGTVLGSLGAIDFGRESESWSGARFNAEPYKRVVEAELALGAYNVQLDLPIRCYDNGGHTFDRYTVVYMNERERAPNTFECVGMSDNPYAPDGFGQHSTAMIGAHLGKRIEFEALPDNCQDLVLRDLGEKP